MHGDLRGSAEAERKPTSSTGPVLLSVTQAFLTANVQMSKRKRNPPSRSSGQDQSPSVLHTPARQTVSPSSLSPKRGGLHAGGEGHSREQGRL